MPLRPWGDERGAAVVDFALLVPLLVAVGLAVGQVGGWVVAVAQADRAAQAAAREAARRPGVPAERAARDEVAGWPGVRVDRVGWGRGTAVRVTVPVPLLGWHVDRAAVAVVPVEPH